MKKLVVTMVILAGMTLSHTAAFAQFKKNVEEAPKTETDLLIEKAESSETPVVITLEQALEIALSENVSVKVADMEIERTGFAKKGTYAALYPQIDLSASYQRTIKKQAMFMAMGEGQEPMKIEVGMYNTINIGSSVVMPLVNAQLWESLKISGMDVELAVEKARSSRLEMVTQVKNAYFATLFAKEAAQVYNQVYENALKNF